MKIKRLILSFILAFSLVCFSACKKKTDDDTTTPSLTSPTVNVSVLGTKFYIGDVLSSISLVTEATDTAGVVSWDNSTYVLVAGENICGWTFTPTDTATYSTKTGSITITAVERPVEPEIVVSVSDGTYYEGQKLSAVPLEYTPSSIAGNLSWVNPNQLLTLGENECLWRFVPTDQDRYATIMGMVTVETSSQFLSAIEILVNPTKMTGYKAFDEFDDSGMLLKLIYNAGRMTELDEGWTISYPESRDHLVAGTNVLTVSYAGKTCNLTVSNVAKIEVLEPTFKTETFEVGKTHKAVVETNDSENFTYDKDTTYTNANPSGYPIEVSLVDKDNYKWKNSDAEKITVPFIINKISLQVTEHDYTGEYDGEEHYAYVVADGECTIYYSESQLTSTNYATEGSPNFIKIKNVVADKVIYYYIVSQNYFDESGELLINITKQEADFSLQYCYTIQREDYSTIEYPREYISLHDKAGNELPIDDIELVYYTSWAQKTKTSFVNSRAEESGGAPAMGRETPYEIHVSYSNDNISASGIAYLFIDKAENMEKFYAAEGEDKFAFKVFPTENRVEYGSNSLCEYYLEFELGTNESTNLLEVRYTSKFGKGINKNSSGIVVYNEGYKLVDDDGTTYDITTYENKGAEDDNPDSVTVTGLSLTLEKWIIPDYLGTFKVKSIADDQTEYDEKYSYLTLYNDHGTIKFEFEYNLVEVAIADGFKGGHGTFVGVAEYSLLASGGWVHNLDCYITTAEYASSSALVAFNIQWWQYNLDDTLCVDPQEFVVIEQNNGLQDVVGTNMAEYLTGELTYTDSINPFIKVEE